jgi:hypothetical protein
MMRGLIHTSILVVCLALVTIGDAQFNSGAAAAPHFVPASLCQVVPGWLSTRMQPKQQYSMQEIRIPEDTEFPMIFIEPPRNQQFFIETPTLQPARECGAAEPGTLFQKLKEFNHKRSGTFTLPGAPEPGD